MKRTTILFFFVITLLVLGPLLLPGYVLTLDMVFGPNFIPAYSESRVLAALPVFQLIQILSIAIPNWLIQKLIFIIILFVSGVGMASLLKNKGEQVQLLGGLFYMLNPFVYTRFLAGHWLFLLGYALFPLWIASLLKFISIASMDNNKADSCKREKFSWSASLQLLFLTNLIIILSYHHVWFMLIIGLAALWFHRKELFTCMRRQAILLLTLATLIIQSYWLLPLISNTAITQLSAANQLAYFSLGGESLLQTSLFALTGYGFWAQFAGFGDQFVWLSESVLIVISLILVLMALGGLLYAAKMNNKSGKSVSKIRKSASEATQSISRIKDNLSMRVLSISALICLLIALIAETPAGIWLYDTVPGIMMMRDTHKWLALWMLVIALGIGYGWLFIKERVKNINLLQIIFALLILLIALQGQTMFFGFQNQLKSVKYPEGWHRIASVTQEHPRDKILVLPWHQYLSLDFNDNLLTLNPAFRFFENPLIYAETAQFNGSFITTPGTKEQHYIDILDDNTIEEHELSDVHYVLLLKEVDYERYVINLPIRLDTEDAILYEVSQMTDETIQ